MKKIIDFFVRFIDSDFRAADTAFNRKIIFAFLLEFIKFLFLGLRSLIPCCFELFFWSMRLDCFHTVNFAIANENGPELILIQFMPFFSNLKTLISMIFNFLPLAVITELGKAVWTAQHDI